MNTRAQDHAGPASRRQVSSDRDVERSAPLRCQCYAAWSDLTASPHDVEAQATVRQRLEAVAGPATGLPAELHALLDEFVAADIGTLKAEYSGLFEVGSNGPPVPIREDLCTGQKAGTREDLVRFYDYFGYRLGDNFAWAPDHLSVELEFMHFLCFHEAGETADKLSYQLAQADFAQRHLHNWVPQLAASVARLAPDSFYSRVLNALRDFVVRDLEWQESTIVTADEGAPQG